MRTAVGPAYRLPTPVITYSGILHACCFNVPPGWKLLLIGRLVSALLGAETVLRI